MLAVKKIVIDMQMSVKHTETHLSMLVDIYTYNMNYGRWDRLRLYKLTN